MSHAYKGQLVRGVTLEELRAFLTAVLVQPNKSRGVIDGSAPDLANTNKPGAAVIIQHEPRPPAKNPGKVN